MHRDQVSKSDHDDFWNKKGFVALNSEEINPTISKDKRGFSPSASKYISELQKEVNECRHVRMKEPVEVTGSCVFCGIHQTVVVPGAELEAYREGTPIQNALTSVSLDDREFILSRICCTCWHRSFGCD